MDIYCPVCGYNKLHEPPYNCNGNGSYEICVCCGFQFGLGDDDFDNKNEAHFKWREKWVTNGCNWFSKKIKKPENWDVNIQLKNIN